jgi:hypothetical protein
MSSGHERPLGHAPIRLGRRAAPDEITPVISMRAGLHTRGLPAMKESPFSV